MGPTPGMDADAASGARGYTLALIALVLGACAIGGAPILVRLAEAEGVAPTTAALWRMMFAVPGLMIWAALARPPETRPTSASAADLAPADRAGAGPRPNPWRICLLAGLLFAGDLATWHAGIVRTTAANATLLANLTPVFLVVIAWVGFGERPSRRFGAGLAAALVGVALLSGLNIADSSNAQGAAGRSARVGDALCMATALWYAGYMLAVRHARQVWSAAQVMLISTVAAIPVLLLVAVGLGEDLIPPTGRGWLIVAVLGAGVHVFGQGAIAFGLGRVPAVLTALVVLCQPVVAAAWGWRLFGEVLGPPQLIGAGLVLAGVLIAQSQRQAPGRLARGGRAG